MRLILFLSLLTAFQPQPVLAGSDIPEVDAIFADVANVDTPGCSLGVIENGEFIYRRGYGMANLEHNIPLTSASVFRIASVSKQFAAIAVAVLAQQGKIRLDDPLLTYFPEFPPWAAQTTIRQMIHHTSGIRDYLVLAHLAGKGGDSDHYSNAWAMALLARQRETNFEPGTDYLYSNSGYILLAELVQRVSGQTLREFSDQYLFGPLGMSSTHFHDDHTEIVPGRAAGYAPDGEAFRINMSTLDVVGDGAIFTTVDELLLWDRMFYENPEGSALADIVDEATTSGHLNDGESVGYGFGLSIGEYRGLPTIGHGGAWVGYRTHMVRFPEQEFTVIVLCNRADGGPSQRAHRVADYFLADRLQAQAEAVAAPAIAMEPTMLQALAGDYWETEQAFLAEVVLDQGKLWAVHSPGARNELQPVGPGRFRMIGFGYDATVEFDRKGNTVSEMRLLLDGSVRARFKPFTRGEVSADALHSYSGHYYSPELDVRYELFVADDKLQFTLNEMPPQVIEPMFDDTFEAANWGTFVFSRQSSGKIDGFELQARRVRNLRFEREDSR